MRVVNALFMIIILAVVAYADTTWVSDTVSGTWTSAGNPYILTGNCYVADGESLFVEEGVRIISVVESSFTLAGALVEGSASSPVYITRVGLDEPFEVKYCVIESCSYAGITHCEDVSYTLIRYCGCGISNDFIGFTGSHLIIHDCEWGISGYFGGSVYRSLFYQNDIAIHAIFEFGFSLQRFNYCTFVSNDFAYTGQTVSYYGEDYSTDAHFYDCIIGDPLGDRGSIHINNSYCYYEPGYYTLERHILPPCFIDSAGNDYRLDSLSPYIDMGKSVSLDTFEGFAPDLGAFESNFSKRSVFLKSYNSMVEFSPTEIGTSSVKSISLKNFGNTPVDSVLIETNPPFSILSTENISCEPGIDIKIYVQFEPLDCDNLIDTLRFRWFFEDIDSTLKYPLNGSFYLSGAISGTLSVTCSPYAVAGRITVEENDTLLIEPCCILRYTDGSYEWPFLIYGHIVAEGTPDSKIEFSDNLNIVLYENSDTSIFKHCVFDNVKISGISRIVIFQNCEFTNCHTPFDFQDSSSVYFDSCLIHNNSSPNAPGGKIVDSKAVFNNCILENNYIYKYCLEWWYDDCTWWDIRNGTTRFINSKVTLNNCIFINNKTDTVEYSGGPPCAGFKSSSENEEYSSTELVEALNCVFHQANCGWVE